MLRPFKYTHVLYDPEDVLGQLMALVSLMPVIVLIGLFFMFLSRRDLRTVALVVGILMSESVNYVLKKLIRQPRPDHVVNQLHIADGVAVSGIAPGYGMPSAHAQFMAFLAVASALWARDRWHVAPAVKQAFVGTMVALWALTIYSRLHLVYHTFAQVAVGSVVGALLGAAFHVAVERFAVPVVFPRVMRSPLAQLCMLKDTSLVHNVLQVEQDAYESARRGVLRKRAQHSGAVGPPC